MTDGILPNICKEIKKDIIEETSANANKSSARRTFSPRGLSSSKSVFATGFPPKRSELSFQQDFHQPEQLLLRPHSQPEEAFPPCDDERVEQHLPGLR